MSLRSSQLDFLRTILTMRLPLLLLASICLCVCFVDAEQLPFNAPSPSSSSFSVKSIARQLELGGATSKATTVYTIQQERTSEEQATSSTGSNRFIFSLDSDKLSWLDATLGKTSNSRKPLTVSSLGFDAARCIGSILH